MTEFKIKPISDALNVLDPQTLNPLKKEGETKPQSEYWLRRVLDKTVTVIEPQNKKSKKETAS